MRIETLIVAIDQTDHTLVEKMNIQTDTIVGNQCDSVSTDIFRMHGRKITYLNTMERGVGRNRNLVLKNAEADLCVLADDDMRFIDGYPEIAEKAFHECPDADVLIFNLIEKKPRRFQNTRIRRIRCFNYAKYGAARLAIRRKSIVDAGITFNTLFGGGAHYSAGEDTIFLKECLNKGLKLYAVPYALAEIDQESESTWFKGYNEKYFYDKGALYAYLYPTLWPLLSIRFLLCRAKKYKGEISTGNALIYIMKGGRAYRTGLGE